MRTEYHSDISREQFAQIQTILESARKKTKPRTVDLYDVFLYCSLCVTYQLSVAYSSPRLS